jgi:glycosyltransferase involved in cell wall biosynthesis
MTQTLGLANHLIFTGFRSDIPQIMAMSELVVHSASEPEPFGRVVVEAMLAGRPVVATAAGGVLDIIEERVTGLTVPPKDVAAMTGAIQYLLQHPEDAAAMGQRAQQEAGKRFSVEQHVHSVQSLYQQILD